MTDEDKHRLFNMILELSDCSFSRANFMTMAQLEGDPDRKKRLYEQYEKDLERHMAIKDEITEFVSRL